jgi:diguanylate cyclase (GGDEF)-like protein
MISFIDDRRHWFKSAVGLSIRETPRHSILGEHAMLTSDGALIVEDARADSRYADDPLVSGDPNIRFYAGVPLLDPDGCAFGTLSILDTEPRRLSQAELEPLVDLARGVTSMLALHRSLETAQDAALRDPLTGLANRALFERRLAEAVARARHMGMEGQRATDGGFAMLCLDLDRFKAVNDLFGHAGGDALLCEVARRLSAGARVTDTVARLGGDEFALLMSAPVTAPDAASLAARLIEALAEPFAIEGQPVPIRSSIGFALYPGDAADASELLRRADAALYASKRAGRGRVRRFEPDMDGALAGRQALERDLKLALANSEFTLAWQPIANAQTGNVIGYEALLRWHRQGHGPVSPADFVPVAGACGIGGALDDWVLRAACREAATWPDTTGQGAPGIAVNVSPVRFRLGGLPEFVEATLAETGLAPSRLELEVSEGTLIQDDAAAAITLERLRALGARVALDDFGTGYSSLGYLHALPFDKVKLDRAFIRDLDVAGRSQTVVRAVLQLGRALGITVCAEGVETQAQLSLLRAAGCEEVQGYLIGRPGPPPSHADAGRAEVAEPQAAAAGPSPATAPPEPTQAAESGRKYRSAWLMRWIGGFRARTIGFTALALLPLAGMASWHFEQQVKAQVAAAEDRVVSDARTGARELESLMTQARTLLTALSAAPEVVSAAAGQGSEACLATLRRVGATAPWQSALTVIRPDGIIVCSTTAAGIGRNVGDRPHFQRALQTRHFVLSGLVASRSRAEAAVYALQPVRDANGAVSMLLTVALDPDWLIRALVERIGSDRRIGLVDGNGALVARHPPAPPGTNSRSFAGNAFVSMALAEGEGHYRANGFDGEAALFGFTRIADADTLVLVGLDEAKVTASIQAARRHSYAALVSAGVLLLLVGLACGEFLLVRPLRALNQTVDRFARGELKARVKLGRWAAPELASLALRVDAMADRLAAVQEHERKASAAKSWFLGAVSHELRTPLNGILGWTQLLRRDARLPRDLRGQIDTILAASEHMAVIVNRLTEINRIERGALAPPNLVPVDPREIAEACATLMRPQAEAKGLAMLVAADDELPAAVMLDATRTKQILLNFLTNAITFTDTGHVVIRITRPQRGMIRFEVADTGPGVPAAEQSLLFRDFTRLDAARRHHSPGAGLGLALSARIAAHLGGTVGYEAGEYGQGSNFWLQLPAPDATLTPKTQRADVTVEVPGRALSILVVDDIAANRLLARAVLEDAGHQVDLATDGNEGVTLALRNDYDIVLMDILMPGLSGIEATRRIRVSHGARADVPILAVTAAVLPEQMEACFAAGMDGFIEKPIQVDALKAALERAAHREDARRPMRNVVTLG